MLVKGLFSVCLGCACLLPLLGCTSPSPIGKDGIPRQEYLVGAGLFQVYRAAVPGTLWVVEENSRTVIYTESIQTGYNHHIETADIIEDLKDEKAPEDFQRLADQPLQIRLYFIPDQWVGAESRQIANKTVEPIAADRVEGSR
jgi:hypothetical protein